MTLPPIGVLFSVTCGVTGVRPDEATRPTLLYLGIVTFRLVLVGLFPWVTLSVPRYLGLLS